ncbi:MAG TPA: hypothetical protein PL188_11215 [Candidatus Cloacimonadota bacterium]|nr:hypothetical protein [Candidatus Cloacimonadota bacterium]
MTNLTVSLNFKGRDELEKIISEIGKERSIPVEIDISKANLGMMKELSSGFKDIYNNARLFASQVGLAISGVQQMYRTLNATLGSFVRAAQDQESAEMALKGALRATGMEVEQNAQALASYASQLQKATIYGDELLMISMAQMQAIARFDNTETLMRATKAAIGLSSAFGIDLGTAMDLVGKAAAGNTSMLGRYGIVLDETASQAEKFSQVVAIGSNYFSIAESQALTATGSIQQLKNAWGDLQEVLAEGVLPVITGLSDALKPMINYASAMSAEQRNITMGLVLMNALVVKNTLAVMANQAAYAALTIEQQRYVAGIFAQVAIYKGATIGAFSFSAAMKAVGASFVAAGQAVKTFFVSIGPVGLVIIGITAAYAGLNAVLKVNTKAMKDMNSVQREALEQKREQISRNKEETNATLRLADRYEALVGSAKRSKDQQRELASIQKTLADRYPGLISTTGNYSKSLEGVKKVAGEARNALAELSRQQWETELALAKNNLENYRIEVYETLSKEFNWLDIWFSNSRFKAVVGVKDEMKRLLSGNADYFSEARITKMLEQLQDLNKQGDVFNKKEQVALQAAINKLNMMLMTKQNYNRLLKDGIPKEGAGGNGSEVAPETNNGENDKDRLFKRLEDFKILQEALFNEESAAKQKRTRQYQEELKLVGNNEEAKSRLRTEYLVDTAKIERKYQDERAEREKQHYNEVKFYAAEYYDWQQAQIEAESWKKFPNNEDTRMAWRDSQLAELNKEKATWDNKDISEFESKYDDEMGRLAELQQLGLITYSEIAAKAWEYYRALQAIVQADGELTEAEAEMLEIYLKRAQKAQLAVNRDSDVATYYNQVKFLDSSYYDWKKARIEEDVRLMDISEEQKATILKQRMEDLDSEQSGSKPNKSMFDRGLDLLGVPEGERSKIKDSFQRLSSEISSLWNNLYANLNANRDSALDQLEERARKERKSEAWLASEKEKINAQYEKKARALKRTERGMQISSALMNTYEGVTNALTIKPAWLAPVFAASVGALGLTNVAYIAAQKFARGGSPSGYFRGKGTSTSDSNLIAISDTEYIISADRVKQLGVPFFDALNFGDMNKINQALASVKFPASLTPANKPVTGYSSGGSVGYHPHSSGDLSMNVVLKCDGRTLAKAVAKGSRKIIST